MNKFKDFGKYCIALPIKSFWKVAGFFLPIKKNLVVLDSFVGKQYSCNPRAIYEYLKEVSEGDIEFVWAFRDLNNFKYLEKNKNTKVVKYHSFVHQYYFYRAKFIIFNWKKTYDLTVRKGQQIIQTWHGGGCYKKAGTEIKENSKFHARIMEKETNVATYYVSSSRYFSERVIRQQQHFKGKILEIGMPRNDCLIHQNKVHTIKVREQLKISNDKFVILYAPTYRDSVIDQSFDELDYITVSMAAQKRFGRDVVFLYRGHHYSKKSNQNENIIDVSDYFDMQDLLLISDMLISDYSSSIWDYSFTYKPCFLYTPDLEKYIEGRGLDEDIYTWGFPVALSNNELKSQIIEFDEEIYKKKMNQHHSSLGSFEKGIATAAIGELILSEIRRN